MRADKQALQAQEATETARREAGKLGMQVLEHQVRVTGLQLQHGREGTHHAC